MRVERRPSLARRTIVGTVGGLLTAVLLLTMVPPGAVGASSTAVGAVVDSGLVGAERGQRDVTTATWLAVGAAAVIVGAAAWWMLWRRDDEPPPPIDDDWGSDTDVV